MLILGYVRIRVNEYPAELEQNYIVARLLWKYCVYNGVLMNILHKDEMPFL